MIRQDYLMRLLHRFIEDLVFIIQNKGNKPSEEVLRQVQNLSELYLKQDYHFFYESDWQTIIDYLKTLSSQNFWEYTEMAAEFLFRNAEMVRDDKQKLELLSKALKLHEYINAHGSTFSMERQERIAEINSQISGRLVD